VHQPIRADGQFVLQDQLQEFRVIEPVAGGFLQPHVKGLSQPRQPELPQG
jgi:hypothetical protein